MESMGKIMTTLLLLLAWHSSVCADNGKKVFETYCWGCHHQTAEAFGPSFSQIASQRTKEEIQAMITDPASVSKILGYKRNAMPAFTLTPQELKAITDYIMSFKGVEGSESNASKENNATKIKEPYPNMAVNEESK
jgi:mono/diheme cytochrome c family protein